MRLFQNSILDQISIFAHRMQIFCKPPTLKRVSRLTDALSRWQKHRIWYPLRVWKPALLCLLIAACQSQGPEKSDPCAHFLGLSMREPYHVIIGKPITFDQKKEIASIIEQTFREIDQTFNPYNPLSEISRLNTATHMSYYPVSEPLFQMLLFCDQVVQLSSNRFDPTTKPLTDLWKSSFAKFSSPSFDDLQKTSLAVGWHHISLQNRLFRKDNALTQVDCSSPAKGLCVDWITDRLLSRGYSDLYVVWGGNIRAAGKHPSGNPWQVQVDPQLRMNGRSIAPFSIENAAISTTADCKEKTWHLTLGKSEHFYSHIIDPIKACPMEKTKTSIASVSVIAPSAALASSLATAAMVFSQKKDAQNWAQEVIDLYPQVSFWILSYDIKN